MPKQFLKYAASIVLIAGLASISVLLFQNNSSSYDFTISEYDTGLFDDQEDELIASLEFDDYNSSEELYIDYLNVENTEFSFDDMDSYLDSDIEIKIEF